MCSDISQFVYNTGVTTAIQWMLHDNRGFLCSVFYAVHTNAYTKGMNSSFDLECQCVQVSCALHFWRERCFVRKQLEYEMEKESPVALESLIQDEQENWTSHRRQF